MKTSHTPEGSTSDRSAFDVVSRHSTHTTGEGEDGGHTRSEEHDAPGERSLPKDVLFGLLSTERRRRVLEYMAENGPQTSLTDLAEFIAAKENDTEIRLISSQQRKRVYVALYQTHLPKMDDAGVVAFDSSRGTVELLPNAAELYRYMEVSPGGSERNDGNAGDPISKGVKSVRSKLGGLVDS